MPAFSRSMRNRVYFLSSDIPTKAHSGQKHGTSTVLFRRCQLENSPLKNPSVSCTDLNRENKYFVSHSSEDLYLKCQFR